MENSASQRPHERPPKTDEGTARFQELRMLLTGPEQRQLADILKRLNDPVLRAEELGHALPDAISVARDHDDRIARALQPTIDTALKTSVNKNPKAIADAIYPALGPAIRKAISAALTGMVQSLNHMLNRSLSWQGLKWRLEALRTQRPFAEVVLLHTLVYRVEQIFLIHRKSGLLLQHVAAENIESKDPDLVSGMLTAIQDFVKDSFDTETGEMLDTLRMDGDHSVWIEQGRFAFLAAVIRGLPPVEMRNHFRELLTHIHQLYGNALDQFDGRTSSLAMITPDLEDALVSEVRQHRKPSSPLLWLILAAGLGLAAVGGYRLFDDHRHWQDLLSQLRNERGVVLTTARKIGSRYYISGFKDPLARDIGQIVLQTGMDPRRIESHWQPFHALDDTTVIERAGLILKPPPSVSLTLANGTLTVRGDASHEWVKHFRRQAGAIPGIQGYDDSGLTDTEMNQLRSAITELEKQTIFFDIGNAQIGEDQKAALFNTLETLLRIQQLNSAIGVPIRIAIIGQTDPSGQQAFNLQLSQRRAQAVLSYLIQNKIDPADMHAVGSAVLSAGTATPVSNGPQAFRSVTFKAFMGGD